MYSSLYRVIFAAAIVNPPPTRLKSPARAFTPVAGPVMTI
jgi:hypothetical protein